MRLVSSSEAERTYGPTTHVVSREGLREYSRVVGEDHPLCTDREAARAAGMRDVVAPPMFVAVYAVGPIIEAVLELVGEHIPRMLHAQQRFLWHEPVCSGDVLTTTATLEQREDRQDKTLLVLHSTSTNQFEQVTADGWWTELVRGGLPPAST